MKPVLLRIVATSLGLTFGCALLQAESARAVTITFTDNSEMTSLTANPAAGVTIMQSPEGGIASGFTPAGATMNPTMTSGAVKFVESATDTTLSDVVKITLNAGIAGTFYNIDFASDPLVSSAPAGAFQVNEPFEGQIQTFFQDSNSNPITLPADLIISVSMDTDVPEPASAYLVGAGLIGLLAARGFRRRGKSPSASSC